MGESMLQVRETAGQLAFQFKILLIGDSGVGKTSIMNRFTEDKFSMETKSTIGVEYSKRVLTIDSLAIQASIWDTAGQERFRALAKTYYKGAVGALLVFDVSKPHTLDNVDRIWVQEIKANAAENIKIVLVGNKADLPEGQRLVKQEDAMHVAQAHNLAYIETSALNASNIDSAFEMLVREIKNDLHDLPKEIRPKNLTTRQATHQLAGEQIQVVDQKNNTTLQASTALSKKEKKSSCC